MPQEIISEKEIALNEKVYQITGKVNRFKASQFAPKTVIGGYDDESDPIISTFTIRTFNGGLGQRAIESPEDGSRTPESDAYIRLPNQLTMAPEPVVLGDDTTVGDQNTLFADFRDQLWAADSASVQMFNFGSDAWEASEHNPGASGLTDFKAGYLNDSAILVLATDSGSIRYSNTPSDSTSWTSDSAHNTVKFAFWRDMLWAITDSGELAFTPDISSGWTQTARLRSDTGEIVEMLTAPFFTNGTFEESLYVATKRGLFHYDNENERFSNVIPGLAKNKAAAAVEWNGSIYYSQNQHVFRFTPGPQNLIDEVGPTFFKERLTTGSNIVGQIKAMTSGPTGVYAVTDSFSYVFEYDGRSWAEILTLPAGGPGREVGDLLFGAMNGQYAVYTSGQTSLIPSGVQRHRIPLLGKDILNDESIRFGGGVHRFPWFDGLIGGDQKTAISVGIAYNIPDTADGIEVYYRLSDTSLFSFLGSTLDPEASASVAFVPSPRALAGEGSVTFPFSDSLGNSGLEFERIQLRLSLFNGVPSDTAEDHINHTPIVKRVSFNYIKDQTLRWGFRVGIRGSEQQSPTELHAELESLFTTNKLHKLTFRNDRTGSPETHKVKAIDLQSAEESGYGQDADYVLTLVEVV